MKMLIVIRGSSGAGKSTYARRVKAKLKGVLGKSSVICSADNYFLKDGEYKFDAAKLSKAHEECFEEAEKAMRHNVDFVLIDNTNVSRHNFKVYIDLATEYQYAVVEKVLGLELTVEQLMKRGTHNVPIHTVESTQRKLNDSVRNRG